MPTSAAAKPRLGRVQELTRSECFELLANEHLGRVAVTDDRGPVVFPVNFVLDRHTVVFRTEAGTKLHAASQGSRVCFEVDGTDLAVHTRWSVIVRGEITEVTDRAELARLRELPLRVWGPGARTHYVRILPALADRSADPRAGVKRRPGMGTEITRETFSERDYARFTERLERCLSELGQLLGQPGFGAGPATVGAELELFLVDGAAQAAAAEPGRPRAGRRPPYRRRARPL